METLCETRVRLHDGIGKPPNSLFKYLSQASWYWLVTEIFRLVTGDEL